MSAPSLPQIDSWDPSTVHGAVELLGAVAERLPGWRIRLEAIGRELAAPTPGRAGRRQRGAGARASLDRRHRGRQGVGRFALGAEHPRPSGADGARAGARGAVLRRERRWASQPPPESWT